MTIPYHYEEEWVKRGGEGQEEVEVKEEEVGQTKGKGK